MKAQHLILAAALLGLAFNGAVAENKKKTKKDAPVAAQAAAPVATEDYAQKIADMQKSIDQLRTDIEGIKTARSELQVKLDQSDKDIAAQMMKVDDIKKKLTEKKKEAEALAKEKKR
jgi:predicted RNase H-like nuclease (RuvC/YqgF family)